MVSPTNSATTTDGSSSSFRNRRSQHLPLGQRSSSHPLRRRDSLQRASHSVLSHVLSRLPPSVAVWLSSLQQKYNGKSISNLLSNINFQSCNQVNATYSKDRLVKLATLTYFRVATLLLALVMLSTMLFSPHVESPTPSRHMMEVQERQQQIQTLLRLRKEAFVQHSIAEDQKPGSTLEKERESDSVAEPEVHHVHHNSEHAMSDPLFGYSSHEEMQGRHNRFPSVDERVQVYMTNWYLPPCSNQHVDKIADKDAYVEYNFVHNATTNSDMMLFREARTWKEKIRGLLRHFTVDESTDFDLLRFMTNRETLLNCDHAYCTDLVTYLLPAMERAKNVKPDVPILYQFSDAEKTRAYNLEKQKYGPYPNIPHLKKFRYALSKKERERVVGADQECSTVPRRIPQTVVQEQELQENPNAKAIATAQPIIFKLKIQRHYGYVKKIPSQDRPWSQKKDQAIFRGQFTGRFPHGMNKHEIEKLTAYEQCQLLHRCQLVYNSAMSPSSLVDARLALPVLDVRQDFPQTIDGIDLYGERVSIEEMLEYKVIIMLEGNDVSSGLKWALYSNSVVMTQTPTKTSWALEELLEPWVHYVPLADDLSDVQEKMQWVLDNDEEAQRIAHRGKLWIADLVFHPDAEKDEELIFDDILRRYRAHFKWAPDLLLDDLPVFAE